MKPYAEIIDALIKALINKCAEIKRLEKALLDNHSETVKAYWKGYFDGSSTRHGNNNDK